MVTFSTWVEVILQNNIGSITPSPVGSITPYTSQFFLLRKKKNFRCILILSSFYKNVLQLPSCNLFWFGKEEIASTNRTRRKLLWLITSEKSLFRSLSLFFWSRVLRLDQIALYRSKLIQNQQSYRTNHSLLANRGSPRLVTRLIGTERVFYAIWTGIRDLQNHCV